MYQLDSTRGLRTTAHTADQALNILGQHLHDLHRDGPIQWLITGPGKFETVGYLDITGNDSEDTADSIQLALDMCSDRMASRLTTHTD